MSRWLFLFLVTFSCSNPKADQPISDTRQYKLVGYVSGSRMDVEESKIDANKLTHINYAFANIIDGKVVEGNASDEQKLKKLNELKQVNPDLKILISVGGWSWSGGFSDAALTPTSRELFAQSSVDFMLRHQLDGIDLDWEYPGLPGAGNIHRPEDKENFTLLLALIRSKLNTLPSGEKYLLTIASAASQQYLDNVDIVGIIKYLDFVNIMTYDFHGGWEPQTGHHTNLWPSEADSSSSKRSASIAVNEHLKAGIPSSQLVLGVAFYGRGWKGVTPNNQGLSQPAKEGFELSYKAAMDSLENGNGYERFWDESAKAAYLWNSEGATFITYEDEASLKSKMKFIKDKRLGGAMFWEYHADNGDLLETVSQSMIVKD